MRRMLGMRRGMKWTQGASLRRGGARGGVIPSPAASLGSRQQLRGQGGHWTSQQRGADAFRDAGKIRFHSFAAHESENGSDNRKSVSVLLLISLYDNHQVILETGIICRWWFSQPTLISLYFVSKTFLELGKWYWAVVLHFSFKAFLWTHFQSKPSTWPFSKECVFVWVVKPPTLTYESLKCKNGI